MRRRCCLACPAAFVSLLGHASGWTVEDVTSPRDNIVGDRPCHLGALFVRAPGDLNGNARPVDFWPVTGRQRSFEAIMDASMEGFEVEAIAVPRASCQVRRTTDSAITVTKGAYSITQIFADPATSAGPSRSLEYSLNISRLRGTETMLKWLQIEGAFLVPDWKGDQRNYMAYLETEVDLVKIVYQKLDNEQVVALQAEAEVPLQTGQGRRLQGGLGESAPEALPPIGEVQRAPVTLMTTVDVGHERTVNLLVQSADGSSKEQYQFVVSRPFCPEDRRFFDGETHKCTEICNEGYFGNPGTGRCTQCLEPHCAICEASPGCVRCLGGFQLDGGRCQSGSKKDDEGGAGVFAEALPDARLFEQRHTAMVIGVGGAVLVALVGCLYTTFCGGGLSVGFQWGSDDEDEPSYRDTARSHYEEAPLL